jgi:salicylate hydroxylase
MEETYGYPYWLVHRADFLTVLHARAIELGVTFLPNSFITSFDIDVPSVSTKDGRTYSADVVIAADGMSRTGVVFLLSVTDVRSRRQIDDPYRCCEIPGCQNHLRPGVRI